MDATNNALKNVKEALKDNAKQTIDYISEINKNVSQDEPIMNMQPPSIQSLDQCLMELNNSVNQYRH